MAVYRGASGEDGRLIYVDEATGARPLLPMPDALSGECGTDAQLAGRLA